MNIRVFTDGACINNPGPGGAGSVVLRGETIIAELVHNGGSKTTNNIMELTALIMSFPVLPKDEPVTIYTDSKYCRDGYTSWMHGWAKRDWKTASRSPVKNVELWKKLYSLYSEYPNVKLEWIEGHQDKLPETKRTPGWEWNVYADSLANKGADKSR